MKDNKNNVNHEAVHTHTHTDNILEEKGITLIALIITIIILIILAAVSLRAVFFDGMIEVRGRWSRKLCNRTEERRKYI